MRSTTLDLPATSLPQVPSLRVSAQKTVLLLHLVLVGLMVLAALFRSALQPDPEQLVYPASILVTLSLIWILWSWYALRKTLFETYPLFMLSAGLFNGGQAVLEALGLNQNGILDGRVSPEILVPALYLVALSLMVLHAGALSAVGGGECKCRAGGNHEERQRATRVTGWILVAIAALPTAILLRSSLSLVLDYGYLGLYKRQTALAIPQALSPFLISGLIFLLAGAKRCRPVQIFCLIAGGLYGGIYLFLGLRGYAAMGCVALAWVFDKSVRRIPRTVLVGFAIVAFAVFPLVRETRSTSGRYRLTLEDQIDTFTNLKNPIVSSVSEMGSSLVTVTHTLALVPAIRDYDCGVSYLYAVTTVMPNIGWSTHPSIAHGTLSEWLIRTVDPVVANAGGGLGFSFIAEAYLNFGWWGGPVLLGLIGYALIRLFAKADEGDPAKQALVASFLSFLLIFSRGEAAIVVRGLVWYALLPYCLAAALTIQKRRRTESL